MQGLGSIEGEVQLFLSIELLTGSEQGEAGKLERAFESSTDVKLLHTPSTKAPSRAGPFTAPIADLPPENWPRATQQPTYFRKEVDHATSPQSEISEPPWRQGRQESHGSQRSDLRERHCTRRYY